MIKIFIILIVLLIPSQALSLDVWTKADTVRQLTYTTLHISDWGQTRDIAKKPEVFREYNPILGKHPSLGQVDTYFVTTLVGHTIISYLLPAKTRKTWQYVSIGIMGMNIIRNRRLGLTINF